ncbi:MAG: hypothetical protein FJ272_20005, partial [Planctomycetes bacterium]|nr:hypothetical protein [Planctomycetota bacterium]
MSAFVAVLVTFGLPLRAETALSVELQATAQAHPSVAGAWVDFPALLRKAGATSPFKAESVSVRPADGAPVPSRVESVSGTYRVFWQVPAAKKQDEAGVSRAFRLELPAAQGTPKLPDGTLDNLVDNGGFERASADGVPDGIAPAVFKRDFQRATDSGGHALAFNANEEGHGPSFTTAWVAIQGGQPYTYSFRHRADKAEAHPRYKRIGYGYVNYRDAAGKLLPRVSVFDTRLGDTEGWKDHSATLTAPAEARWA